MEMVNEKLEALEDILASMDSVLIAFSGGVDSTFLVAVAARVLSDQAVAATAHSPLYPDWELAQAAELAEQLGIRQVTFDLEHLQLPEVAENRPDRCYHCKRALFSKLQQIEVAEAALRRLGFEQVRVRHHGQLACVEVYPEQVPLLTREPLREKVVAALQRVGFTYVTADLAGYRSGSMDEAVNAENGNNKA